MNALHAVKLAARADVLSRYGLLKTAAPGRIARFATRLFSQAPAKAPRKGWGGKALDFGGQVLDMGRDMVFGSPVTMANDLAKYRKETGTAGGAIKKYYKNFFWPDVGKNPGFIDRAGRLVGVAFPAMDLYQAATGDPDDRTANIASAGAGLALSPITSRLGIPGGMLSAAVSGGIQKALSRKPTNDLQQSEQNFNTPAALQPNHRVV